MPDELTGLADGPSDGLSDLQVLDNVLAKVEAQPQDTDTSDAQDTDVDPVDAAIDAEPDADASDKDSDDEPAADDDKDAEPEPDDTKPTDKKDKAEPEVDDGNIEGLTIKKIDAQIKKSPELKELLDKNPEFKNQLFYTARRAARANEYDELFQTPALAKEAARAAEDSYETHDLFESDATKFLEKLLYEGLEKNEDGSLKIGKDGRPTSNGRYEETMQVYRNSWYGAVADGGNHFIANNKVLKDPAGGQDISGYDVLEAIRIIQIMTEGKSDIVVPEINDKAGAPQQITTGAKKEELSDDVKAKLKELDELKAAKNTSTSVEAFRNSVDQKTTLAIETDVRNLLAKRLPQGVALSDYMKDTIVTDAVNAIAKSARTNAAHQSVVARALRGISRDEAGVQKIVAIQQAYAKELIGRELAKVLSKATQGVVAQNAATRTKVNGQLNRREASTSGGAPSPTRPDARQTAREIEATARKSGKQLTDMELLDQVVASQRGR